MQGITKEARYVLVNLYREYLNRRDRGFSRSDAALFGDSNTLQKTLFPGEDSENISDLCWELHRQGYLFCTPGDNLANDVTLLPKAIVAMEQRFPNGLKQILDALGKLGTFV